MGAAEDKTRRAIDRVTGRIVRQHAAWGKPITDTDARAWATKIAHRSHAEKRDGKDRSEADRRGSPLPDGVKRRGD